MSSNPLTTYPLGPSTISDAQFTSVQTEKVKVIKSTVSQETSTVTGVTINASSGVITMQSSTLADGLTEQFTVTNSNVSGDSVVLANALDYSGTIASAGVITVNVDSVGSGSFVVSIGNGSGAPLDGIIKVGFLVV